MMYKKYVLRMSVKKRNTFVKPVVRAADRYFDVEENATLSPKVISRVQGARRNWQIANGE